MHLDKLLVNKTSGYVRVQEGLNGILLVDIHSVQPNLEIKKYFFHIQVSDMVHTRDVSL